MFVSGKRTHVEHVHECSSPVKVHPLLTVGRSQRDLASKLSRNVSNEHSQACACMCVCVCGGRLLIDEHGCHTHAHTQLSFNSLEIRAVIEIPAP